LLAINITLITPGLYTESHIAAMPYVLLLLLHVMKHIQAHSIRSCLYIYIYVLLAHVVVLLPVLPPSFHSFLHRLYKVHTLPYRHRLYVAYLRRRVEKIAAYSQGSVVCYQAAIHGCCQLVTGYHCWQPSRTQAVFNGNTIERIQHRHTRIIYCRAEHQYQPNGGNRIQ